MAALDRLIEREGGRVPALNFIFNLILLFFFFISIYTFQTPDIFVTASSFPPAIHMKFKRMTTTSFDPRLTLHISTNHLHHGTVSEEIEGLMRVYNNGHVERTPIIPTVSCTVSLDKGVASKDVVIDKNTSVWARVYIHNSGFKLPLLLYFHGGGFCVGSAAWKCYHEFLSNLTVKVKCVIVSVNYRLCPENRLPSAYEDGFNAVMWLKQQVISQSCEQKWWLSHWNQSSLFIGGDSAGGNIAYHVGTRGCSNEPAIFRPLSLKGIILIQPFFGGESRTSSEKYTTQPLNSALTLSVSDTYWRWSLPFGANRDHPWCNPLLPNSSSRIAEMKLPKIMVCVSELDILKDREMEFAGWLTRAGKKVERVIYKGVGHAFQVLFNSPLSSSRTQEMMSDIFEFVHR